MNSRSFISLASRSGVTASAYFSRVVSFLMSKSRSARRRRWSTSRKSTCTLPPATNSSASSSSSNSVSVPRMS